jgi:hypothetical protein
VVDTPNPLCEGTRVYTYSYEDCGGGISLWHFTYTIEREPFQDPMDGGMIVDCPDDTDMPPALPTVMDDCNGVLLPVGPPDVSPKPLCQGLRTYTYTYEDCEGNTQDWVFTYNVIYQPFPNPTDDGMTVDCPDDTDTPPSLPTVMDNCGNTLSPTMGSPIVSPKPTCQGMRT